MDTFSLDIRFKLKIYLMNVIVLLFIFRSSIPSFKYPFIVSYFCFLLYWLFSKEIIIRKIRIFFNDYILIFILAAIFFISVFFSGKLFLENFKDSLNVLVLLSFLLVITTLIGSKDEFKFFISNLINCIITFSVVISFYGIYEFFYKYFSDDNIIRLSELSLVDYNFALLPVFFGMLSILYILPSIISRLKVLFYNILLLVLTLQVFISSSRRGFLIINIILIILYLSFIVSFFYNNNYVKLFIKKSRYYLIIISLVFLIIYIFVFETSNTFKHYTFEQIGIKNINSFQEEITQRCYRYLATFDKKTTYSEYYNKIWSPKYDLKDPDSGWGTRIHKTVFPLTGENVEIVPSKVKGYLMDSTCNPYIMNGNSYSFTDLYLYSSNVKDNDIVQVSAYCYVSKDFNGDWALLVLTSSNLGWIGSVAYNFEKKGTWQKLEFSKSCKKGEISPYLYFCKNGVTNFITLKGYVIFAYPECKIISGKDTINPVTESKSNVTIEASKEPNSKRIESVNLQNYTVSGILNPFQLFKTVSIQDQDPIRNWASKFISEDTTYHGYKANIVIDTIRNSFFDLRYVRWQFAIQIFNKEYNWKQKMFGGGFKFLNWYSYYFLKDKTKTDYPHNPFLHVLLYSGIVGLILYILLLYKAFYYYVKYIKEYYVIFIFFLITFFFTFFSGGNPFDPPIMGFFMILPFFIHSVHKREKATQIDSNRIDRMME